MLRSLAKDPSLPLPVVVIKEKHVQFYVFLRRTDANCFSIVNMLQGQELQLVYCEIANEIGMAAKLVILVLGEAVLCRFW